MNKVVLLFGVLRKVSLYVCDLLFNFEINDIDAWEAHQKSAITQIYFNEDHRILWTGSKDKTIKVRLL